MGEYLGQLLHQKFRENSHVGDIRGKGLFWAVSLFVFYRGGNNADGFLDRVRSK
jgi:4-aminobutyrate aminotransferase-like enzyme